MPNKSLGAMLKLVANFRDEMRRLKGPTGRYPAPARLRQCQRCCASGLKSAISLVLKALLCVAVANCLAACADSQPTKSKNPMKTCSHDTREWSKKFESIPPMPIPMYVITSHYNMQLKKCVALVRTRGSFRNEEFSPPGALSYLFLVNEDEAIGDATLSLDPDNLDLDKTWQCHVVDKQCSSLHEWNQLVKPFMKD